MVVLGIDPGTAITGFGVISYQGNHFKKIAYGVVRTEAGLPIAVRLKQIYQQVTEIITTYSPEVVVVEELFFNRNVTTAITVGQARGVILLAASMAQVEIAEYTPLQVKQAVVGYGRAEKRQVQEMVRMLLCLPELPKPDDAADALAIAICHAHSRKLGALG